MSQVSCGEFELFAALIGRADSDPIAVVFPSRLHLIST
jgi:hypothetical protein